jgi:hypothetical protein
MAQPKFAPITQGAEARPSYRLDIPKPWKFSRPAELSRDYSLSYRSGMGDTGPDQGFALKLANRVSDKLILTPEEDKKDVLAGLTAIALRRASLFGRAPVITDILLAAKLFGYLEDSRQELLDHRRQLFFGVSHDQYKERNLVALIPEKALMATPDKAVDILSRIQDLSSITVE